MSGEAFRVEVLRAHGAGAGETDELLAYAANAFAAGEAVAEPPLADEPFVAAWEGYVRASRERGVLPVLREALLQLRFPVAAGTSATDAYRAAATRGDAAGAPETGVEMEDAEGLRLWLHPTPAGRIPVIVTSARADFETLVRALTRKNEPDTLPASMGACIVGGYNNWSRVAELRRAWEAEHPGEGLAGWSAAFKAIVPRKELYQDRFIVLSDGPYSAVPAAALGLGEEEWREKSLTIRLEHECAHYFTRRVWGSMRNSLHDELIADYQGIRAAEGRYRAGWFLRFMGLENFPAYRQGGRLQNYRGEPPLSDGAFAVLTRLLASAAGNLERMDALRPAGSGNVAETARALRALAMLGLEELAADDAVERFRRAYAGPLRALVDDAMAVPA